jgi:hypothetical protein
MSWATIGSKRQGLVGIGAAIAFFTSQGHLVNMPLNDSQDYDMIVDDGANLKKVQVKTTRCKQPNGNFAVSLKSSGGTKGTVYGRVGEGNADLLFVHTEAGDNYVLPVEYVRNHRGQLVLGSLVSQFKV